MLQSGVYRSGRGKERSVVALELEWGEECGEEERVAVEMTEVCARLVWLL